MGMLNYLLGDVFTEPNEYFMEAQVNADYQRAKFEADRENAYREFIEKKELHDKLGRIEAKLDELLNKG